MDDYNSLQTPPIEGIYNWWPFIISTAPYLVTAIAGLWGAYLQIKNNKMQKDKIDAEERAILLQKEADHYTQSLKSETEKYSNKIKSETEMAMKEYEEKSKQQAQDYARWNEFQNDLIKETKELRDECRSLRESLRIALDNIADRDKQIRELRNELIDRDKQIVNMTHEISKLKMEVATMQEEIKSLEFINEKKVTHRE
jgi:chromosome segregation ATPase